MNCPVLITLEAAPRIGGVASYIGYALRAAKAEGFKIRLAAPKGSTGTDIPLPCSSRQSPLNLFWASLAIRKIAAPCVYIAEAAALRATISFWAWNWTKKQKVRLILHGSEILELKNSLRFRQLLKQAERIYTLSRYVAGLVLEIDATLKSKIVITGAAPSPDLTHIEGLGLREAKKLITVARLHPRKGQLEILELMQSGELKDISYEIAGPSRDKSYTRTLEKIVKSNKLSVTFHGNVDDAKISLLYSQSSLFVLPATIAKNRVEGFGLALLDAAAFGLPVVAYDIGGISEAVKHCRTGILVPPGDKKALAEAILQLLNDDNMRAEFSRNSITWANENSWEKVARILFT